MLSNTCKYGIRAVIYLAVYHEELSRIGIRRISNDLEIPTPFLGKILQSLVRHGVLISTKGPNGGFALGRSAEKISLLDIINIIDGPDSLNRCLIGIHPCDGQEKLCVMHERYAELRKEMNEMFRRESIADLAKDVMEGKQRIVL